MFKYFDTRLCPNSVNQQKILDKVDFGDVTFEAFS